jgi:tetratricopeptide (TPR) repeat protein
MEVDAVSNRLWKMCRASRTLRNVVFLLLISYVAASAQRPAAGNSAMPQNSPIPSQSDQPVIQTDANAEEEMQKGTALTSRGAFAEAIPHLLVARGRVANEYAASFNLALSYAATGNFAPAIQILAELRATGHDTADVNNLLAQAYIGNSQDRNAFDALQRATSFAPSNEKLYTLVADACMAKQNYAFGLQVTDLGLAHIPASAKLRYERGMFLSLLDQFDSAKKDFDLARNLSPESAIAFIAAAQESMLAGNVPEAVRAAREGGSKGHHDFMLLTLLGEALLRSGIAPGEPAFAEARNALEKSVEEHPNYVDSQLALGKLYLLENRLGDAIFRLEMAQQLSPASPAIYSNLATAYRRAGDRQKVEGVLAVLARLNQEQAEKIRSSPGDHKVSYSGQEMRGVGPPGEK